MMRAIGIMALSTVALAHIAHAVGIRPNFSASAPMGLWIERPINDGLQHGMMVVVCPPHLPIVKTVLSAGDCHDTEVSPLLKTVMALPGDRVRLLPGLPASVNGTSLPGTTAQPSLAAWPDGEYIVQPGQAWVFSFVDKGFDSRYFGPVSDSFIRGEAYPLMTR